MKSKTLEGASSHKNRRDGVYSAACSGLLRHHADIRARKDSWRCSFHLVLMKENLLFRGTLHAGGRCTAWNDPVMPELYWRVAQCTRYATGCTNADQLDQDLLWSGEGWQVGGRLETKQGRKLPGSTTMQYTCIRSVRTQSHSHTPRQRPSTRRSRWQEERERGKLHSPVRQRAYWWGDYGAT